MRAAFYMAALVATRSHPKFRQVYLDLRAAGKPAKVALVAVARRMVGLANALIRNDMTFENARFRRHLLTRLNTVARGAAAPMISGLLRRLSPSKDARSNERPMASRNDGFA